MHLKFLKDLKGKGMRGVRMHTRNKYDTALSMYSENKTANTLFF